MFKKRIDRVLQPIAFLSWQSPLLLRLGIGKVITGGVLQNTKSAISIQLCIQLLKQGLTLQKKIIIIRLPICKDN